MQAESKKDLAFKNSLYRVTLVSFVTVAIWIGFEIYWAYQKKAAPPNVQQQIEPLNPNIDTDLIDSLSTRKTITIQQLEAFKKAGPTIIVDTAAPVTKSPPPSTSKPASGSGQSITP